MLEAAKRHLDLGLDPEDETGLVGIDVNVEIVNEGIRRRIAREARRRLM